MHGVSLPCSALVLAALALPSVGCSTKYLPRGPGVSMVLVGGSPAFARDGEVIEHGFFGDGLVEAVEGDAEAMREAEAYRDLNAAAFGLTLGGLVVTLGSTGFLLGAALADVDADSSRNLGVAAGATAITGLGLVIAGVFLQASAQPKLFDAINLFNDGVALPPQPGPAPIAPGPAAAPAAPPPSGPPPASAPAEVAPVPSLAPTP